MKILILSFFLVLCSLLYSQGNLQFNQAKLITTVQTVPSGKVWKVESAQFGGGPSFLINNMGAANVCGIMAFSLNGTSVFINTSLNTNSSSFNSVNPFPIWLPAGSTIATSTNTAFISVIEFNIIP